MKFLRGLFLAIGLLASVPAWATTYYVAKSGDSGSASNNCTAAQSISTPRLTIRGATGGMACLGAGDTLIVRRGTYTEGIEGDDWVSGSDDSHHTIIKAKAGESVTINGVTTDNKVIRITNKSYITIGGDATDEGFIIDSINTTDVLPYAISGVLGTNSAIEAGGASSGVSEANVQYLTVQNNDITDSSGIGVNSATGIEDHGTCGVNQHWLIKNNSFHGFGNDSYYHGIYTGAQNSVIEGNHVYGNYGMGIHQNCSSLLTANRSSNNVFRYNRVHDNGSFGLQLSSGRDNLAYNNIVYGNGDISLSDSGIRNYSGGYSSRIWNNTIYGNAGHCINIDDGAGGLPGLIQNNICYMNGNNTISISSDGTGVFATQDHNICSSGCLSSSNPLFTSAATGDFTITNSSPAYEVGATLVSVVYDFTQTTTRPQNSNYEIGAYEVGTTPPMDPVILLTSPLAGFSYKTSSDSVPITWTTSGITGNIRIWYSPNAGTSWRLLTTIVYSSLSYSQPVNVLAVSDTAKICIEQDASGCAGTVKILSGTFQVRGGVSVQGMVP